MDTKFGAGIRRARDARGLTQGQLAARVGLSSGLAVSRWERGVTTPTTAHLVEVARVLGTTIDALGGGHDPDAEPSASVGESAS